MQKSASRWQQPRVAVAKSPMATMASNSNSSGSSGSCSSSSFHLHNCSAGGLAASTLRRDQLLAMRKRRAVINVAHHSPVKSTTTAATRTAAAKRTIATGHAPSSNISSSYWEQRRKALTLASSRKQMLDADCPGFEPQNYLKERCKKCFRLREKHEGLSPLRHVPVERQPPAEDIVVLGPKAGAKRTQSIATTTTAAVRRVSVKKVAAAKEAEKKETDKEDEGKKNVAALRMVAVETETEEEEEEKPHEKQQKLTTRKEEEKQEERQQPPATKIAAAVKKSSTTTVLLPKQRQISLGGSKQPAATASNRESRNGWQFMSRQYASANGDNNSKKSAEQSAAQQNGAVATENSAVAVDSGGEEEDLQSLSSYRTANSRPANSKAEESSCGGGGGELHSAHSVDSLNSLSYAESFKTGKSPPFEEDDPFMTPTNTEAHFFLLDEAGNGGNDFDRAQTPTAGSQLEFSHLRLENQRLAEQCRRYRHERRRWTDWLKRRQGPTAAKEVDGQRLVEEALTELELMVSEYREENSALKSELDRVRDQDLSASAVTLNGPSVQQLEERARSAESACEQLRREREELQQEIDEMQDQYRVEEIEEFRELQRELEMNAKNCRILQFKLRKSERQREQLQAEKNLLAKKYQEVRRANGAGGGGAQSPLTAEDETLMTEEEEHSESSTDGGRRVAELEQELRVAKEISVKLHTELEQAEERRYRLEDELFYNKEKVRELLAQNKWREAKNSREQQQQSRAREVLSGSDSSDQEQQMMHREVRDSLEREADLREQLRFTEADLQRTRTRLRELELDNDELQQKFSRLAEQQQQQQHQNTGGGSGLLLLAVPKRPNPLFRSISEGSEAKSSKSEEVQQQKTKQQQPSAERGDYNGNMAAERKDTTVDAEQLCYMLAAMDAQANRICKQLEKLDGGGQSAGGSGGGGSSSKEEKRRSLKGDIVPVLEELGGLLAEMKAIKEQLAKSQNIALTKSMIVGNVLGDSLKESAEGGNDSSCSECEDTGRRLDEFRDSCDFYKRKNAELTEQVLQMKDQWAKELRRLEEEADTKSGRMTRQMDELRAELEEQRLHAKVGDKALEECRAELAAMAKRLVEAGAELDLARARAAGVDKGEEERTKWETRCKEMKADRIRLQAEVAQLKRRTDEAVNELEKMRATHQHKEIAWIREKLKLEEQQKQQLERLMKEGIPPPTTLMGNGVVATGGGQQGSGSGEMKARIAELEKENIRLEKELQESRAQKQSQQEQSAQKQQQQQPLAILREAGRPLLLVEGTRSSAVAGTSSSRVDYKQIADNALKAAESLQRQYREYQRQYTMEVQRLNGQLGQLERELADRERRLRDQAAAGAAAAPPPPPLPPSMQIRRAVESPSMSSLTENTTWDSRLLDCSMTRSISPFKFPRGNCPMMQCRTVDIHPTAAAAACAQQQQQQQHEAAGPHFGSEEDMHREYRRTGSSGTNILYRIRREELSKGKHPSVRQMAKAFESFEKLNHNSKEGGGDNNNKKPKKSKSGGAKSPLFGLLSKASSTTDHSTVGAGHHGLPPVKQKRNGGGAKQQHRGSFGRATESPVPSEPSQPAASSTLPRGGRNPFKGMGSRIVDRVRRSLSRSKKSQSRDATPSLNLPEEPVAASSRWK